MARYIDADKIIKNLDSVKELSELEGKFNEWQYARYIIKSSEIEDVIPIIRGKCSMAHGMYENRIWCNNCGFIKVITGEEENYNFCPKCGAIVEESEKNK